MLFFKEVKTLALLNTSDFKIDVSKKQSFKYLLAKQYDHNSRSRRLIITDDNVPIIFTGKELITLSLSINGDNYSNTTCQFGEDGYPYIVFTDSMLSRYGDVDCEIRIYDSDGITVATTFDFMMTVSRSLLNEDRIVESSEFNVLNDLILQANTIPDLIKDFNESQTNIDGLIEQVNSDIDQYQQEYNTTKTEFEEFQTEATTWYTEAQEAENLRVSAETERQNKENERIEAENARANAETLREQQETARQTAETARNEEETTRDNAEKERISAEDIRIKNENERIANEDLRKQAETERDSAEDIRIENENERIANENARKSAEEERNTSETERNSAEQTRIENENQRILNEQTRQAQEEQRQEDTAEAITNCTNSTIAANDAVDRVNAAIENLEFALVDCDGGTAFSDVGEYENDFNGGGA